MATAGLILGILGVITFWIPFLGLILGGLALIFGVYSSINKGKGTASIVLGIIAVVFGFFILMESDTKKDNNIIQDNNSIVTQSEAIQEDKIPEGEGDIGKYHLKIEDYQITKDYSGDAILLVKVAFTNNSDESKAFSYNIEDKAFQDGVEIKSPISTYGIKNYDWEDSTKEIKPGVTYEFNLAYELNNKQSDVTIELSLYSFISNDTKITKTFKITE